MIEETKIDIKKRGGIWRGRGSMRWLSKDSKAGASFPRPQRTPSDRWRSCNVYGGGQVCFHMWLAKKRPSEGRYGVTGRLMALPDLWYSCVCMVFVSPVRTSKPVGFSYNFRKRIPWKRTPSVSSANELQLMRSIGSKQKKGKKERSFCPERYRLRKRNFFRILARYERWLRGGNRVKSRLACIRRSTLLRRRALKKQSIIKLPVFPFLLVRWNRSGTA